jgi:hypothetical protein
MILYVMYSSKGVALVGHFPSHVQRLEVDRFMVIQARRRFHDGLTEVDEF